MTDRIGSGTARRAEPGTRGRRMADPLAETIAWDLIITIGGFVMIVAAVVLTVQGLSVGG